MSRCRLASVTFLAVLAALFLTRAAVDAAPQRDPPQHSAKVTENRMLRGKVVWLAEALQRLYGVRSDDDVAESSVALETADGQLVPLLKDSRGRGFWTDPRLRGVEMELLVRQQPRVPLGQVISVYTLRDGQKFELDYWCDICAIPMYELKPCECCQGETRLRERPVVEGPTGVGTGDSAADQTGK